MDATIPDAKPDVLNHVQIEQRNRIKNLIEGLNRSQVQVGSLEQALDQAKKEAAAELDRFIGTIRCSAMRASNAPGDIYSQIFRGCPTALPGVASHIPAGIESALETIRGQVAITEAAIAKEDKAVVAALAHPTLVARLFP